MANAREPFDAGTFSVYGLPFSPHYDTPTIYFQPAFLFLGGVAYATGLDPGLVYVAFGLVWGVLMFRIALELYAVYAGTPRSASEKLAAMSLLWGGGVAVLTGLAADLFAPSGLPVPLRLFRFDPVEGYWLQNLGRNVFYSTEALYHALFLGCVLLILRRRWRAALVIMALTAISHPFTGVQLLLVVSAFIAVEFVARMAERPPVWFAAGTFALLGAHLTYYLWFLNWASPEHRVIQSQWTLEWVLPAASIAVLYGPVAVLAAARFVGRERAVAMIGDQRVRFALAWAMVSLALAKHDLFFSAHQPLHFTRGHIWTPLALLAAPVLAALYASRLRIRPHAVGVSLALALWGLVVLDNAVWFGRVGYLITQQQSWTLYIRKDLDLAFARLSEPDMAGRLFISNDELALYFSTVYTPLRAWRSHGFNTPNALARRAELDTFLAYGTEPPSWRSRPMVALADDAWKGAALRFRASGFSLVGRYGRFEVMIRDPR